MIDLSNKKVIITGGSGLIGRSILKDLIRCRAFVINLDLVKSDLESEHMSCDITSIKQVETCISEIIHRHERIDGLINNAYPRTNDWGQTDFINTSHNSDYDNLNWQLTNQIHITRLLIKNAVTNSYTLSIVNIGSIYGSVANDLSLYDDIGLNPPPIYTAIKGGLVNFTKFLASAYGKVGIRANCVSPGGIIDKQNQVFIKRYNERVPMRRMGFPDDISPTVCFLISDLAGYITGQNINIDGGWTSI
jgi:NAD(P)-dependent dehydrogenase (short-subunit alcohol dehydrogenase family)